MVSIEAGGTVVPGPSKNSKLPDDSDDAFTTKVDFAEVYIDDELDPAMKEELDR